MRIKNKLLAVLSVICMAAGALYGSTMELNSAGEESITLSLFNRKESLYFWYTDESMTDFINSAAVAFGQERDVRVIPQLASQSEYLEAINEASLYSDQIPDVYMISNDSLGKACLAGLASEVQDSGDILNTGHFPQSALSAVTYKDNYVAYPFFYETSALIYNETYLEEWARQQAEREAALTDMEEDHSTEEEPSMEENNSTEGGYEEGGILDEEAVAARTQEYMLEAIPGTIDDILNIADTFDVPEGVEGVMKWDVSDIFYNYWFTGNYMIAGGDPGDDEQNININNTETVQCLEVYKALNQFFYIESDTVTYDSVVQDFIDGKLVFTIATTDVVRKLEEAKSNGSFAYNYGVAVFPEVSQVLESRSMSVTNVIAVNGYSQRKELANEFAAFLTNDYIYSLYERTGKVSANLAANTDNGALQIFMEEYADSVPLPKMIETSNYWIQLEILFSKVWNGEDAAVLVRELSDQILTQAGTVTIGLD